MWEICWRADSRQEPDPPCLAGWTQTEFLSRYCSIVYVRVSRDFLGSLDAHTQLLNRESTEDDTLYSFLSEDLCQLYLL